MDDYNWIFIVIKQNKFIKNLKNNLINVVLTNSLGGGGVFFLVFFSSFFLKKKNLLFVGLHY